MYLVMSLSFTEGQMDGQRVVGISVDIRDRDKVDFIDDEQVIDRLKNHHLSITGEPIDSINKALIKEVVLDLPHVSDGEVYFTPDGQFHIMLMQRIPVMRVISGNMNYYVDQYGEVFPTSPRFSSKVPVFTGSVDLQASTQDLLRLAIFLNENEFWGAMVEQVQVWSPMNIELIPKVGNHRILLGDTEELEWKFEKLKNVYEQAFPVVGWDNYESVDLRFSNQVVCKRKKQS